MFRAQTRNPDEDGRTSAFVSMAVAAILGFASVAAAVTWTASRANDIARREQSAALESAVRGLFAAHEEKLRALAQRAGVVRAEAEALRAAVGAHPRLHNPLEQPHDLLLVEGGRVIVALDMTSEAGAANIPAGFDLTALPKNSPTRLYVDGERLIAAASEPLAGGRRLVALTEFGQDELALLAWKSGAQRLRIAARPPVEGLLASLEVAAPDPARGGGAWLVWEPSRPGDNTIFETLPLFMALTALFGAWVALHLRRVNADTVANARRAMHLAGHDRLTDLPNRSLFGDLVEENVARAKAAGLGAAVLCVDLRRFKEINDNFGHAAGDALLAATRDRLSTLLKGDDVLARVGGDEFAILKIDVDRKQAEAFAAAAAAALRAPLDIDATRITPTATIGIAIAGAGVAPPELLRCADIALFEAKAKGAPHRVFESRMIDELRARKRLELDLRQALADGGLYVDYQPIMAADGRTVVGAEALARWRHPVMGFIGPTEFVALAEERGMIDALGDWVLRRACLDARDWPSVLYVSVNVSAVQFRQADFLQRVDRVLAETGFDPARLVLELTESAVVADEGNAEETIIELRARGVRMALDDFGTGYSSLIYLRRFAFDKIKIDRSFLEAMETTGESAIIVQSIVHLGRSLGLTVTAEGVETQEQHRFLQALGCHEMQGFVFARPGSLDELVALVAAAAPPIAAAG
ncbi:MAG: bifunctional diguanylate cyclase/phosphodiesterase [Methylobacteriaceae bacterium]|nr:bifunctional diguanylate cyclase/phosphodiesterase [Methylobacteriaceae bacterium]